MAPRKPTAKPITKASSRKSTPNPIKSRKAKVEKPCKHIFKGSNISFSGDFGNGWEYEKMAKWVRYHGGIYEPTVSEDTTHLICTVEDYKKKSQQVRKAWALGPICSIVVSDWLEDCLVKKPVRHRAEIGYTLDRVLKRLNKSAEEQQKYRDSFEAGVKVGNALVDNRLYHVYYDGTGFEYKIVCQRFPEPGNTKCEKYTIYLFESHAKPSLFYAGAKLCKGVGHHAAYWNTEAKAKVFSQAWNDFKYFFLHCTGINWDDRCDGLPPVEGKFRYVCPTLGRPVGFLLPGKKVPEPPKETPAEEEEADLATIPEGLIYDTDSEAEESDTTATSSPKRSYAVKALKQMSPISISSDSGSDTTSLYTSFSTLSLTLVNSVHSVHSHTTHTTTSTSPPAPPPILPGLPDALLRQVRGHFPYEQHPSASPLKHDVSTSTSTSRRMLNEIPKSTLGRMALDTFQRMFGHRTKKVSRKMDACAF